MKPGLTYSLLDRINELAFVGAARFVEDDRISPKLLCFRLSALDQVAGEANNGARIESATEAGPNRSIIRPQALLHSLEHELTTMLLVFTIRFVNNVFDSFRVPETARHEATVARNEHVPGFDRMKIAVRRARGFGQSHQVSRNILMVQLR